MNSFNNSFEQKRAAVELLKQVKAGDEVYYYPYSRRAVIPTLRKVERVTPAGFIDVRLYGKHGDTQGLTRFKDGTEVKRGSTYFRDEIRLATPELRAEVAEEQELLELRGKAKAKVEELVHYHADHYFAAQSCREIILTLTTLLDRLRGEVVA